MQNQTRLPDGQVPKNWQKVKLGDVGFEVRDLYEPTKNETLPYVGLEHIEQQTLRLLDTGLSSETQSTKKKFSRGDILFGTLRPYFRKVVVPKYDGVCSTDITVLKAKPNYDQKYLFYFIANEQFINYATNSSNGTRMPRANWKTISKSEWLLPPLPIQQKISSILSSFDDKIEVNNKIAKILEEMAQAIYKEWFVHFRFPGHEKVKMIDSGTEYGMTPESWKPRKLGEKLNILKGKNITKNTIIHGKVPVVAGGLKPAYYHNKANAQCPVITISASGANSGFVNLYQEDVWVSDCSYIDRKTTPFVYFYYLFLKNKQIEITGLQRGSAQPHVYPKDLMQLSIIDIPEILTNAFEQKVELMFDALKNLKNQNQCLRQTRDLLLPKLMSGKLRVN